MSCQRAELSVCFFSLSQIETALFFFPPKGGDTRAAFPFEEPGEAATPRAAFSPRQTEGERDKPTAGTRGRSRSAARPPPVRESPWARGCTGRERRQAGARRDRAGSPRPPRPAAGGAERSGAERGALLPRRRPCPRERQRGRARVFPCAGEDAVRRLLPLPFPRASEPNFPGCVRSAIKRETHDPS